MNNHVGRCCFMDFADCIIDEKIQKSCTISADDMINAEENAHATLCCCY